MTTPSPLSTLPRKAAMNPIPRTLCKTGLAALLLGLGLPALAATVTLNPTADAYVQAGTNAAKNYGTATTLNVRTSTTTANNYDSYLKFDTSSAAGAVTSAKLRLYSALSASGTVSTSAYAVSNTTWGETTITWNNKPALGASLGSVTVNSTTYAWKEIDVTAYVQSEKAAGRAAITLGMHDVANTSPYIKANSRNATSNKPQLLIVTNAAPTVSIATPISGSSYTAPAVIRLTANAADSDGTVQKVEYFNGANPIGSAAAAPYTFDWTNVPAGSYTLTAKATDNANAVTASAAVNITVNPPPNVPPTVSLTAPANGAVYIAPAAITLTANTADSDGTVSRVDFYNGITPIGSATAAPYTFTWTNVPAGTYVLTAQATDNLGATIVSTAVNVTVNDAVVGAGVYYIYADQLNTPRAITDSSNKVIWRWDSDPFGTTPADEDPDKDGVKMSYNLRFPGQYYDKESGLHYNYYRDYDPSTGRYVASDPIGLRGGVNTYTYVGGNPVSRKDPLGLEWSFSVGVGATAALGWGGGAGGDFSGTVTISSSGVSFGVQSTTIAKVYGGYIGYGGQMGAGVGDPICKGPSGPVKSDWIGGGAGWGPGAGASANFGDGGISVGRGVGGEGFGAFYGEGKSTGGYWGFTW
jgi:RHS repeat-associated protein